MLPSTSKPIPGLSDYYADIDGSVWSTKYSEPRKLKPGTPRSSYPYFRVQVMIDGKKKKIAVHVCVLRAFRGERPYGLVARHLNGVSTDNRLDNLMWGTVEENNADKIAHGHSPKGSRHHKAKLTEKQALMIYSYKPAGKRDHTGLADTLASEYNVCRDTVVKIWQRKIWAHIHNA